MTESEYLEFIADVMEVDPSEISMETRYNEHERWDSLMMLTLVMELEAECGTSIPIEKVNSVTTLKDLYALATA